MIQLARETQRAKNKEQKNEKPKRKSILSRLLGMRQ